jgi:hypothetical protein
MKFLSQESIGVSSNRVVIGKADSRGLGLGFVIPGVFIHIGSLARSTGLGGLRKVEFLRWGWGGKEGKKLGLHRMDGPYNHADPKQNKACDDPEVNPPHEKFHEKPLSQKKGEIQKNCVGNKIKHGLFKICF